MSKGKESKGKERPKQDMQSNALIKEYMENEGSIRSQYQSYTGSKAGLSIEQVEDVGKLWKYYTDKVFLSIDSYKELKVRTGFSFIAHVCGVPLPKGISYDSTEEFCKTNGVSYYQEIKIRQMRLVRLAELAGFKEKKSGSKTQELTALERVMKMVLGAKSKWNDEDRKSLLNSLIAHFKAIESKGKAKSNKNKQAQKSIEQLAA